MQRDRLEHPIHGRLLPHRPDLLAGFLQRLPVLGERVLSAIQRELAGR